MSLEERPSGRTDTPAYVELAVMSNFSFLRGASHPEELVVMAKRLGLAGLSLCDVNSVAGVVRAHMAAKEAQLPYQPGCRLVFSDDSPDCLVWPKNLAGWQALCRLLSIGNLRAKKGSCILYADDLLAVGNNLVVGCVASEKLDIANSEKKPDAQKPASKKLAGQLHKSRGNSLNSDFISRLKATFGPDTYLVVSNNYDGKAARNFAIWQEIATQTGVQIILTNNVLYHRSERRMLHDVVTCIREHVTLENAGFLVNANCERHLKDSKQMHAFANLWPQASRAIANTIVLFSKLEFSLDELRYQYPDESPQSGLSMQEELSRLAYEGARERYPKGVPEKIHDQIRHELQLIEELDYAPYFLTVHDIVRFARSQKILCQGRGSAANSTVCYCIGITDVDPSLTDLLFERFISPERREPPDIDVDFEHERREEVIQYIYRKYGRAHSGLAASVVTYRSRSAVREVGKVFGLSEDAIGALAGTVWGHSSAALGERTAREAGLDLSDPALSKVITLARETNGFPRHLSQHVGGFVITRDRLDHVIPIMNTAMEERTQVEWDKDDLESLGILKIDILALGMLTCLRKAFDLLESHYDTPMSLATMPKEDPRTYAMIQRADTIGVFQIESRAQMSMLPRLKPACFYDLVIEVAIVRPGPIQGDMVHPYLRRRQGKEPVAYPSRELEQVLGRTLGVPLFQEQAMKIAIVAAGFSPGEADKLRRAMATFRRVGTIHSFHEKMVEGMAAKGYDREFATRCFRQIEGFGEYGFPESHAASFALLVYASCWLKCHYPDVFAAAILNSQPMGFYSPAQLVRDAREHGVEVLAPDVNFSDHDGLLEKPSNKSTLETNLHPKHRAMKNDIWSKWSVRLGMRHVKGLGRDEGEHIVASRKILPTKQFSCMRSFWQQTGLFPTQIERLADGDAFRSMGFDRRQALWQVRGLQKTNHETADIPDLFHSLEGADPQIEPEVKLPAMPNGEHVIQDYRYLSLSLKAHPVSFLRDDLTASGFISCEDLERIASGSRVSLCGLVVSRQRPGTAKGVVFMTLEDESGIANIIIWAKVMEAHRPIVMGARLIKIRGQVQKADGVIHLIAEYLEDAGELLLALAERLGGENEDETKKIAAMGGLANADEVRRPVQELAHSTRPGKRLSRLLKDVPDLKGDYQRLARETKKVMPKGRNFH